MTTHDFTAVGTAVMTDLTTLSGFSEEEGPGVTRPAWSAAYFAARDWLAEKAHDAGLTCRVDPIGNLWCTWEGTGDEHVIVGSHIDTVPHAGRFDGCLGVLGGLHAIRNLMRSGKRSSCSVHLVAWIEEEGTATGTTLLGSRTFAKMLANRSGRVDVLRDSMPSLTDLGPEGDALLASDPLRAMDWEGVPHDRIRSYLELHIEQGPVLESARQQIGVVEAIVGYRSATIRIEGRSNHAGTTPMPHRADALVAAARIVTAVRDQALSSGVTATVGKLGHSPNAANVIPGRAALTFDLRAPDDELLDSFVGRIMRQIDRIAAEESVGAVVDWGEPVPEAPMDVQLRKVIRNNAEKCGFRTQDIFSGALHDAAPISRVIPSGMIFVPSHLGISHAPDEFTAPDDCGRGVEVLSRALSELIDE